MWTSFTPADELSSAASWNELPPRCDLMRSCWTERREQHCTRHSQCLQEAAIVAGKTAQRVRLCLLLCPFTISGLSAPRTSRLQSAHQGKGMNNSSKARIISERLILQGFNDPAGCFLSPALCAGDPVSLNVPL